MCYYVKFRFSYEACNGSNKRGCGAVVEKMVSKCTSASLCALKKTYDINVRDLLLGYCPRCAAERGFEVEDALRAWKSSLKDAGVNHKKLIKDLEVCTIWGGGDEEVWEELEKGEKYHQTGLLESLRRVIP